jgi:hypothetical protein
VPEIFKYFLGRDQCLLTHVEATAAAAGETHHGIRVVPTTHFNPGAGMTAVSTEISGKHRGKHQPNALLASAASLESQRARNPTSQKMSSHRATAKRKYGW